MLSTPGSEVRPSETGIAAASTPALLPLPALPPATLCSKALFNTLASFRLCVTYPACAVFHARNRPPDRVSFGAREETNTCTPVPDSVACRLRHAKAKAWLATCARASASRFTLLSRVVTTAKPRAASSERSRTLRVRVTDFSATVATGLSPAELPGNPLPSCPPLSSPPCAASSTTTDRVPCARGACAQMLAGTSSSATSSRHDPVLGFTITAKYCSVFSLPETWRLFDTLLPAKVGSIVSQPPNPNRFQSVYDYGLKKQSIDDNGPGSSVLTSAPQSR